MPTLQSKLNKINVFGSLIVIIPITGGLFYFFFNEVNNSKTKFLFDVLCLITAIIFTLIIRMTLKNSKKIIINPETIKIGSVIYDWKDAKIIKLKGKNSFWYSNKNMEGITLKFEDKTINILDDYYLNYWEMKLFIQEIVVKEKDNYLITIEAVQKNEMAIDTFNTYKGSPFFSFRGIMLWSMLLFFGFILINPKDNLEIGAILFISSICLFWFLLNSHSMYYFELSKNFLVVKNHYFFWIKKAYRISDIKEIVYETGHKQANMMRIITKDFKRKIFRAGTLRDRTWLELKHELEKRKIKVRNECIF